jgi:hypothetical protein
MCLVFSSGFVLLVSSKLQHLFRIPVLAVIGTFDTVYIASGIRISAISKILFSLQHYHRFDILAIFTGPQSSKYYTDYGSYSQMLTPGSEPEKVAQPTL